MSEVPKQKTTSFKITNAPAEALLLCFSLLFSACNPTEITSSGQRAHTSFASPEFINRAFIYRDGPGIVEGPKYGPDVNMKSSTDTAFAEFITRNNQLKGECSLSLYNGVTSIQDCIRSYATKSATQQLLERNSFGNWIFPTNSPEFYQVNNLYHVQYGANTFFNKIKFAYDSLYNNPMFASHAKAIPKYLPETKLFWFQAITPANDDYFRNNFLSSYALCDLELNAKFSPAGPDLCFGKWSKHPSFLFVQDPSVVYHELGHALIAVMMNFRNGTPGSIGPVYHDLRSNLGGIGYDEAGSIGEGVADYYSFVMNKRTHIGEWALAKSLNASRPMSEDDHLHAPGIDSTPEGRLSYPQYVLYDPNQPNVPFEDVHYAGQITSHYLVALTKELQNKCSLPTSTAHDISTSYVMLLLAETFSELGDLNASGIDKPSGDPQYTAKFSNLDTTSSYMWAHVVNPPTYRKFYQVMSKNILKYISNGLCPSFDKNESEKLLDAYGLLLFKTYNNNGSSTKDKLTHYNSNGNISINTPPVPPTPTNENNRRKSVLVSKQLLSMAVPSATKDVASYYIIDDSASVTGLLKNLLFKGFPMNLSTDIASTKYNNDNIKVSPGEVVAIIPNLYNASNSTMAGVSLLANDWDHVHITDTTGTNGNFKPCVVDEVTTAAQGGETAQTCTTTLPTYRRHIARPDGGAMKFSTEGAVAPACLVQLEEGEVTKWVSQNEFRVKQGLALNPKDCLGFSSNSKDEDFTFNPHECLVRVLPGANKAFYSKIDPQKSYIETMRAGNADHVFGIGNAIMFEVNKWIPPGTKFRCRLRANFSNCSDCFSSPLDADNNGIADDNDDYIDAEFNGAKPYKIINLEFEVND